MLVNCFSGFKVFPSSFSIKAALGNLRMSDDSLPRSHMYFWACDMRNPGGSSFVEVLSLSFLLVFFFFFSKSCAEISTCLDLFCPMSCGSI